MKTSRLLLLFLLSSAITAHAGISPLRIGATASIVSEPFPSFGSLGIQATLLDLLRVEAGFSGGQTIFGAMVGVTTYTYGASARLRVPGAKLSPTVGFGISRSYTNETKNIFHSEGRLGKRSHHYMNPSLGLEVKATDGIFLGGGLSLPLRKGADGTYRTLGIEVEDTILGKVFNLSVMPFFYVGAHFF